MSTEIQLKLLEELHALLDNHQQPGEETNRELEKFFTEKLAIYNDQKVIELLCGALAVESFTLMQTIKELQRYKS